MFRAVKYGRTDSPNEKSIYLITNAHKKLQLLSVQFNVSFLLKLYCAIYTDNLEIEKIMYLCGLFKIFEKELTCD